MPPQLNAYFGLKWNPFSPDVPSQALWLSPALEHFCRRMDNVSRQGGFALISGEPGTGKSVALRLLHRHLSGATDLTVAVLTRPQSRLADFYRELGQLFGLSLAHHNRWAGFQSLREKWRQHIHSTCMRPVLLVDEAQEMHSPVLAELRLLQSADFDSRSLLTVILCGDMRLSESFLHPDLLPIASRIQVRLLMEAQSPEALREYLLFCLQQAGNAHLLTPELMTTLCEHAAGNYRLLQHMANDLLAVALQRELAQLDEKLYIEVFSKVTRPRGPVRS